MLGSCCEGGPSDEWCAPRPAKQRAGRVGAGEDQAGEGAVCGLTCRQPVEADKLALVDIALAQGCDGCGSTAGTRLLTFAFLFRRPKQTLALTAALAASAFPSLAYY